MFFRTSFWEGFWKDSGVSLGHHFQQKSEKRRLQCSMKRAYENGPGKNAIWECFKPRKLAPRADGSTIFKFQPFPEKAWFWMPFGTPFWSLWDVPAQKTRFFRVSENHFIFSLILDWFWYPKITSKINEKSILSVILPQDGFKEVSFGANIAREAPTHVDFHWFLSLIWKWIS